jgi:imidazolonepropionase-like amidohydrolase
MWRHSTFLVCSGALLLAACGDDSAAVQASSSESTGEQPESTSPPTATTPTSATAADSSTASTADTSGVTASSSDDGSGSESSTGGEEDVNTRGSIITECGALTPPASGTCELTTAGTSGVILRGTVLAPGEVLRGGSVFYSDAGVIACVACDCSGEAGAADASVVTCADGVISPGLINPHDHITYANNYPIGQGVDRYEHRHDWRIGQHGHDDLPYNDEASNNVVAAAELRFVMSGATSAASAGGRMGLLRNLGNSDQLEGLPVRSAFSDTFPLDDANGVTHEMGCNYGANRRTAEDIAGLDGYLPHIAEGINAAARNEITCTSSGAYDLIAPQTAVVHAIGVVPDDAATLEADDTKVVWSPRSNIVLYGNTAPVTMLDRQGVTLALGTDWVSSGSMNMQRELRCAAELNTDYFDGYFSPEQLWRMVTTNAAFATGSHAAIGMLKPGYIADIAVFAASGSVDHQAVIDAELADVVLVVRGGEPLYGDDALLALPEIGGAACETLDVCEVAKRACVAQDIGGGTTLVGIRAAIEAYYGLFFCGVPDDEPSCVPFRSEYEEGITATDGDGDGIADATDNCATVFNPVRWLEDEQGDADADAVGDVCDPCPLDGDDGCVLPDPNDFDNDVVGNGEDNCPFVDNSDQADADGDGHGDACDGCDVANPGPSACPASIEALRDPADADHPDDGTVVVITDAYVTGIRLGMGSLGFYVQDDTLLPYSGIFVYTGGAPDVEVGNRVSVSGTYTEYFELSEIVANSYVVDDAGTVLPFEPIDFADPGDLGALATAEPYESMLVSVGAVSIVDDNPDGGSDFDEFSVSGPLRIDDQVFDNAIGSGLGNDCPVGTDFTGIVGIEGFSFSNYKLMPRFAEDIGVVDCVPYE